MPDDLHPLQHLLQQILKGEIPVLLITNAVQVDHMINVLGDDKAIKQLQHVLAHMMVASIGNVASERLRQHEFPVDLEPSHPKMGILVKEASQKAQAILDTKSSRSNTFSEFKPRFGVD